MPTNAMQLHSFGQKQKRSLIYIYFCSEHSEAYFCYKKVICELTLIDTLIVINCRSTTHNTHTARLCRAQQDIN